MSKGSCGRANATNALLIVKKKKISEEIQLSFFKELTVLDTRHGNYGKKACNLLFLSLILHLLNRESKKKRNVVCADKVFIVFLDSDIHWYVIY